jgi:hypothetical protein
MTPDKQRREVLRVGNTMRQSVLDWYSAQPKDLVRHLCRQYMFEIGTFSIPAAKLEPDTASAPKLAKAIGAKIRVWISSRFYTFCAGFFFACIVEAWFQ